jgi:hypothetical protein
MVKRRRSWCGAFRRRRAVRTDGSRSGGWGEQSAGSGCDIQRPAAVIRGQAGRRPRERSGNHRLKNALFLAVFANLRHPPSRTYYARKRAQGKRHARPASAWRGGAWMCCTPCSATTRSTTRRPTSRSPLDKRHRDAPPGRQMEYSFCPTSAWWGTPGGRFWVARTSFVWPIRRRARRPEHWGGMRFHSPSNHAARAMGRDEATHG